MGFERAGCGLVVVQEKSGVAPQRAPTKPSPARPLPDKMLLPLIIILNVIVNLMDIVLVFVMVIVILIAFV